MFKKQDAYNKHRMTLSHIAKLSEQEYLVSQQNQERRQEDVLHASNENMQLQLNPDQERQDNQRTDKIDDLRDDVYAFQDSPCDGDLPSTYSSKKTSNTTHNQSMTKTDESCQQQIKHNSTITDTLEEHEDSQMSSLSFSDRDDFVYGTNTMSEEEEEEEDKNSSISSEQTTPKKLTNADVQKKSLIMGRIFKKGGAKDKLLTDAGIRKCSTTSPDAPVAEVPHQVA
uniref:Uncharacterized protein n=1 Tax=Anopheles minimus TaxID=112268 RepID=A0A182WAX0_9DIPT